MDMAEKRQCRICGCNKLSRCHYADNLFDKIGLYRNLVPDNSVDQLIRPCQCRGDFELAHKICLSNWIETTKHERCDICRFKYNIRTHERSLFEWISETQQARSIFKVICWATFVYYLSALGILNHQSRRKNTLLGLMTIVSACIWSVSCSVFICIFAINLIMNFISWKRANKRVDVDANQTPQLDEEAAPKDVLHASGFKLKSRL